MHAQLKHVDDAVVEMKIARFCLGASKLQHLLRLYGEALTPVLADGDATIDMTLKRLVPGLTPEGR
eukprot:4089932-Lingulodinium_polyedra.AAC.1